MGGEQRVRLARHGALAHVHHRCGRCARLLGEAQRRQRVRGLARLRDEERHAALRQRRRAVAELGCDVDLDRDPRGLLDPVARGEAGVVGGAAGDDRHPLHPVEREGERRERDRLGPRIVVGAHGVADRARLLVDLLQHVVAVVALADHGAVVGGDALRALDGPPARIAYGDLAGSEHRPVALVEIADPAGEGAERQRVRGEVGGVLAVPDGERGAAPGADQEARVAGEDDRERKGAFELRERRGGGLFRVEPALHVGIDQVGNHLGIGVGDELPPLRLQLGPELAVVLDDAVVDHRHPAGGVRVGIGFAGRAMGGPAGVADANCAADGAPGNQAFELDELALGTAKLDQAVGERREARGIVAAVFEAPQPVEDVRRRLIRARDTDDSAHSSGTPLLRAA